jgi:mRNA interferase RelE/StbE
VSYQVNWEIQALDQAAAFLRENPVGVAALWDTVSQLADEPRPPELFPYGSPHLLRLRAGRYRVFPPLTSTTYTADLLPGATLSRFLFRFGRTVPSRAEPHLDSCGR